MFGSRGAWPSGRPSGKGAVPARCSNLHSAGLARFCGLLIFVAVAGFARAGYSFTDYPEDICATESIYLDGVSPSTSGVTGSGIGYTVTISQNEPGYNNRYISLGGERSVVTIRFDKPMAAVGAVIAVSGYGSYNTDGPDDGLTIYESGYRGVVADDGSIHQVSFTTNNGPMSITRVDIRPLPVAVNDEVQVFENSDKTYDAGTLLRNDLHAEGAAIVEPPLHAERFQLLEDGSFIYQPAKDFEGTDSFTYRASNGLGASVSEPATVEIKVVHVNCAPVFTKGPNITCNEDDRLQTIPDWATQMAPGPDQESSQTLTWDVTTDSPKLFAQAPALDQDGTLTFQPAPYESGVATVNVRLHDNGGVDHGGTDTSAAQTFTITIEPKAHAPMLEPILDCAVRAGDALVLQAKATEVDAETPVTYSLENAPEGASIDPLTGQIVWKTNDLVAGKMPEFLVRATETQTGLSSTTQFHVEVLDQPKAPELLPINDLNGQPGAQVRAKIAAKQGTEMRYFLASMVPGALLNPTTGDFHWIPSSGDAGKTISFAVTAVDLATPNLCAMKTFVVHVSTAAVAVHKSPAGKSLIAKAKTLQTSGEAAMKFTAAKAHGKK